MELTSKPASKMDLQALAEVAIGRLMEEQDEALTASKTKVSGYRMGPGSRGPHTTC